MPTSFDSSFSIPLVPSLPSESRPILPVHITQHRQIAQQRQQQPQQPSSPPPQHPSGTSLAPNDIELDTFDDTKDTPSISAISPTSRDGSGSDDNEQDHLEEGSVQAQMRRSRRIKSKSPSGSPRPDLKIKVSHDEDLNGHANGDMDSHIEMRRKPASNDPNNVRNQIMARGDFSLDNDIPPPTPQTPGMVSTSYTNLPPQDQRNFLLLVMLYFLQGIPMGLAAGSIPFLLKKYLSYSQIGVFSLAIYPYSLKLLWSPIVDAVWSPRIGRRKSWIMPIQAISGIAMIYLGFHIDDLMVAAGQQDGLGVWKFTAWWFALVFTCATQDIAVDGWAISLLSVQNISYASTAQTVGLTAGSFLSHTVFLALSAPDFANKWFRTQDSDAGLITLGGYMTFWGWAYLAATAGLAIFKREEKTKDQDGILEVYRSMWAVLNLKNVITIIVIHLIAKLGFVTNDSVTSLKLLDKGFGQANMALVVLIDFPFEIGLGYYAGKWSTDYTPMRLWCWAFVARLAAAIIAQFVVMAYPVAENVDVPAWYLLLVIIQHVNSTFMNTVMFVAIAAFHARIADPVIGGTYMTLLATVSNLGGTFPKFFILKLVDFFTAATCHPPADTSKLTIPEGVTPVTTAFSCVAEVEKDHCIKGGGRCVIERDGFYYTNVLFVIVGAVTFWLYIRKRALSLQSLPVRAWRINSQPRYSRVPSG